MFSLGVFVVAYWMWQKNNLPLALICFSLGTIGLMMRFDVISLA